MLHHEPLLDRSNHRLQRLKLRRQLDQIRTSVYRRAFISFVCNNRQRLLESLACLRGYIPSFGQMRPQPIDHLGPRCRSRR